MPVTIAAATAIHARRWVPLRRRIAILPVEVGIVVPGVENATQGNICPRNAEPVRNGRARPRRDAIQVGLEQAAQRASSGSGVTLWGTGATRLARTSSPAATAVSLP